MPQTAAQYVRDFERDFYTRPVQVVPGYNFNQVETLRRINLYANSQFLDGPKDEYGDRVFFDISTPIVRNAAKNIDLDTKDINVRAINGKDYFKAWVYRRAVKQWLRDHEIARKLNAIPDMLAGIGSVVVKKVPGSDVFKFVDLRNLACDPTSKCLNDSWTSEKMYFTPDELREAARKGGWDMQQVEYAIADFLTNRSENYIGEPNVTGQPLGQAQYICIHEFHGYVPRMLVNGGDDTNVTLAHLIVMLPEDKIGTSAGGNNGPTKGNERMGLTIYAKEISKMPYKEVHFRKVAGRWLGRGLYEDLFPAQEIKNTQINWQLLAMRLSQTIVYQTRNKTPYANILSQTKNGTILKFGEGNGTPLERVDTGNRDLSSTNVLSGEIQRLAAAIGNSYEVTTGGNLPSGTSYALGSLMNQNADKLFDKIREDYGVFLQEVFEEWVLPYLEKDLKNGGLIELIDPEELDYVRQQYVRATTWDSVKKLLMRGQMPTVEEVEMVDGFVRGRLEERDSMFLKWDEGFLDIKKKVEIIVTDERENLGYIQSMTTVLQAVMQNPQIVTTPGFQSILDRIGLSVSDVLPQAAPEQQPQPNQPAPMPV